MVSLKFMLGREIEPDIFMCWFCEKKYNVKNGVAALRRHHESKHPMTFQQILCQLGTPVPRGGGEMPETPKKEIKMESSEDNHFNNFDNEEGGTSSEAHPHHQNPSESHENSGGVDMKAPAWFPSSKGRSIVWEHITWVAESQRAACNYCPAEFQIKGGTSALLRHLKTIHPAAINFDPENPPPVVRRKKRKMMEDYTIVTEDTKSYMDNLLEQFLTDETLPGAHPEQSTSTSPVPPPQQGEEGLLHHAHHQQSRADSEIDEVIRTLQKETAQNGGSATDPGPDQDLRKLLGISDEQCEEVIPVSGGAEPIQHDEEKQVSSSSSGGSGSGKKRKMDESMQRPMDIPGLNTGKFSLSMLSSIRRPPPGSASSNNATSSSLILNHHPVATTSSLGIPAKYNTQAVQCLDLEAKVLYNQTMHSTIAREDAMTTYYRMKARKTELEIKKLERELGEDQDQEQDHEHEE